MKNPWRMCDTDPPNEYIRVEIKTKDRERKVGYRYKINYYETIGNYLIKNPYQWRYIPVGSYLWAEIKDKIRSLSMENGEVAYGINKED